MESFELIQNILKDVTEAKNHARCKRNEFRNEINEAKLTNLMGQVQQNTFKVLFWENVYFHWQQIEGRLSLKELTKTRDELGDVLDHLEHWWDNFTEDPREMKGDYMNALVHQAKREAITHVECEVEGHLAKVKVQLVN